MTQYATYPIDSSTITIVQAAEADLMEEGVSAQLRALSESVMSLTLSGGGDGHTFITEIVHSGDSVDDLLPVEVEGDEAVIGCYLASNAADLKVARAKTVAAMNAVVPPMGSTAPLVVVDEQVAGAAKGTRFMGLIVGVWTEAPPIP
jgi:hypothetical protein